MTPKPAIKKIFLSVKHLESVDTFLLGLGFKRTKHGAMKKVFIHPAHPFVVKVARVDKENFPTPRSKVAKFYLWPERAAGRYFSGSYYFLLFQPKADTTHQNKTFTRLHDAMDRAGAQWLYDCHPGNVALHRGKPVIIDY